MTTPNRAARAYLRALARQGGAATAAKTRKPCKLCGAVEGVRRVYRLHVDPDRPVRLCEPCAELKRVGNRR